MQIEWQTITGVIALIALLLTAVGVIVAYLPIWRAKQAEKTLERSFGADSFDSVQIRAALRFYVDPDCSVIDPSNEDDIRQLVPSRSHLFHTVDDFLSEKYEGRHVLLLADSGMGKTSFLLNYYARNQKKRKKSRKRIAVIPFGRPKVISRIDRIDNKKDTVLMLDAFDEDTEAIRDHRSRLQQVMEACADFRRVVLTCRTQFFASDEEIPKETGVAIVGPRKAGQGRIYKFYKLYLAPFTDAQVQQFLRKRFPIWKFYKRRAALRIINAIPELSVRPMLLAVVPDLVEDKRVVTEIYELYEFMVESWLERESNWISRTILRGFSEKLATDIYQKRAERGMERISVRELSKLIDVDLAEIESWKLTARSLLNRDAEGNYKFAHRSIMEYLYVTAFIKGRADCLNEEWTDLMRELFVSWASREAQQQSGRVRKLLQESEFRKTRLFPLFEKGREPKEMKRNEILTPGVVRRVRTQYSRVNAKWSTAFVIEKRVGDATYLCDIAYNLQFMIPADNRCGDPELMSLFRLTAVEVAHELEKAAQKWIAPTLEEIDLLYLINKEIPFADPFGYYWTSDRSENGGHLCVSFGTIKEGQVDSRLTLIGLRQPGKEKENGQGYAVFEIKAAGVYKDPIRGYSLHVSDYWPHVEE